jgi:hypothetical protein
MTDFESFRLWLLRPIALRRAHRPQIAFAGEKNFSLFFFFFSQSGLDINNVLDSRTLDSRALGRRLGCPS